MSKLTPADFAAIYQRFTAPVSRFDCGRKCAPLNDGEPVCCTTRHAVPIVDRAEWQLLRSRSKLWQRFKPTNAPTRALVEELHASCTAVECRGARFCERDNRSLSCRTFPFFPYITRTKEFIGLATYWTFADRCWLISNLQIVEPAFVREFVAAFEAVFAKDPEEFQTFLGQSTNARRIYSRRREWLPILTRSGEPVLADPRSGEMRPCKSSQLPKTAPFTSERAYRTAVKEANGIMPPLGLQPE